MDSLSNVFRDRGDFGFAQHFIEWWHVADAILYRVDHLFLIGLQLVEVGPDPAGCFGCFQRMAKGTRRLGLFEKYLFSQLQVFPASGPAK